MKTAFLITEISDTETPIVGVLFPKQSIEATILALNDALADHFDVDLGGGDEAVIEIRSIYVY